MLKYSAVMERVVNCVYRAICFNIIEYLQLNIRGAKRSCSLGFCICQIVPYVKLFMLVKCDCILFGHTKEDFQPELHVRDDSDKQELPQNLIRFFGECKFYTYLI